MRVYTIHERPVAPGADPDVVLVKEGFSWPALLVPVLWALYHRLWLGLIVYLAAAALIALGADAAGLDETSQSALVVGFALLVAFEANDWRRRALSRRGYRFSGVVAGRDLGAAERHLFAAAPPAAKHQP